MSAHERIYFDYNASAPLLEGARTAMVDALEMTGNASSVHGEGRALRASVENARRELAQLIACEPKQIIFTSGATEAAMLALGPNVTINGKLQTVSKLFVSAIEHPCVLSGGRFEARAVEQLPVDAHGIVDLAAFEAALEAHDRTSGMVMVAVMLANNETGAIQPIAGIAEIVRRHEALLVVDAVQGLGKLDFTISGLGAHFVLLSAHKIGGPQGAGAVVLGNAAIAPAPLLKGGGQENFMRAGTENVAAIAGFGAAVRHHAESGSRRDEICALRDYIERETGAIAPETGAQERVVFSGGCERLPNTLCFAQPGVKAETALISLDLGGIAVSSGSACSSGKVRKSHVLAAMGVSDDLAGCALRISLGPENTKEQAARFLSAWREIVGRAAPAQQRLAS